METVSVTPGLSPTANKPGIFSQIFLNPIGKLVGADKVKEASFDEKGNFIPAAVVNPGMDAWLNSGQAANYTRALNNANLAQQMAFQDMRKRAITEQLIKRATDQKIGAANPSEVNLNPGITSNDAGTLGLDAAKTAIESDFLKTPEGIAAARGGLNAQYRMPEADYFGKTKIVAPQGGAAVGFNPDQKVTAIGSVPESKSVETTTGGGYDPVTGMPIPKKTVKQQVIGGTQPGATFTISKIMEDAAKLPATPEEAAAAKPTEAETPVNVAPGMPTVFSVPSVGNAMLGTGGNVQMTNPFGGMPQAPAVNVTPAVDTRSGLVPVLGNTIKETAADMWKLSPYRFIGRQGMNILDFLGGTQGQR